MGSFGEVVHTLFLQPSSCFLRSKKRFCKKNALYPVFLLPDLNENNASLTTASKGDQKSKISQDNHLDSAVYPFNNDFKDADQHGLFLRSKWQILGYLNEQADLIEKHSGSFHLSSFDAILNQLQKMAPELHRVRYLQYLKSLYHEDYLPAVDNLHCYFDCSAGMDGLFIGSPTLYTPSLNLGKYESALLCLGTMHCHFGHSKQALEALTEAVRISHLNNDDSCLAYTLTTICNLMSEIGISSSIGVIGSPYTLGTDAGMGMPLTIQQHLLVLLKKSQKRAEELKLTCLVGFNRLALAKFELKNVKRPLLSFGPKAPTTLRTSPVSVCKELRLSSYLFSEFETDRMSFQPDNGTFSTSWLKNLPEFRDSSVCAHALGRNDFDAFNFGAQPNPIPGSVLQLAGASHLLRATSWELLGSAPLARISTLTYLCCFADASSSEDLSLSYAKLIQHLAVFNGHKEAFNVLKSAEERFLPVSKSRIQLQLVHEHALHRGRLKYSQEVCDEFSVLCSSIAGVDLEHKTEASLRHARTLLAANQFNQAADVAHSLFCTCYKYNLHVENASVLLLLAEIHKKSRNAVLGLPYALASLSFCHSFNLDLLEASATLTIAELWLAIGSSHAKRALSLVNRKFAIILGHGGLELCARANIVVTKCYLFDPSFSVCEDPDIVLTSLTQATEDLEILEYHEMAAEAFYLLAMVYDMLGQVEEREEAAFSFKRHIVALEKPEDDNDLYQFLQ
ncbi:Anaphase-promoting complex subunit [Zostera marina]|uniref:Anaphase-promoting complex subunit 5 n=1 Tax=Zostera marina TaxID=29655 RepID=A0A0K9Q261_ZOSMR|nr:Anaphase-promoting complex subunit [Zostera marina]